jgi:hypothetical protein
MFDSVRGATNCFLGVKPDIFQKLLRQIHCIAKKSEALFLQMKQR